MYTLTRRLSVVCLTVVLSLLVYGCGGSSKQALITDVTDMVMGDLMPEPGTYTIEPGGTANAGDVSFTCPEGGPSCEVTVADDGTIVMSTSAEGTVIAMNSDLAIAKAERDAARAAEMAAEADKVAAEEARDDALAAEMAAEADKVAAEEARDDALAAEMAAEADKVAAEEARDDALAAAELAESRLNPYPVDLSELSENFTTITAGIYNIDPGIPRDVDDATFMCAGCEITVTVADDGTPTATSVGSMATAQNSMAANTSKMAIALTATDGALITNLATANDGAPRMVDVKRVPNGNTTITLTPDDDEDGKYSAAVDAGHVITGWRGHTLKRNNAIAETETDNAEPATSMHEATIYTDIVSARAAKLTFKEVPNPTNEDGFGTGVMTYELAIDPKQSSEEVNDAEEFTGYYIRPDDGYKIRGTFTCRTDACVDVLVPEMSSTEGNLLIDDKHLAGWGFESDIDVEEGYVLDEDYLYFGYWLKSPVEPSDVAGEYNFATLYGGNSPFEVLDELVTNTDDALKATYEGGAAGRYVTRQLRIKGPDVDPNSPGKHGRFTAKAKLTAYFSNHSSFDESSDTPAGENNRNKIYGSITDFKDSAATKPDLGFKVDLGPATISAGTSGVTDATSATFDDGKGTGMWSANFFGPDHMETPSKRDDTDDTLPSGVAGQFNVGTDNTRVIGAFAAKKK